MADSENTYLTTREARILVENLARHSASDQSLVTRIAMMERDCRLAARLITAMLRQVHSSDIFQLPPEA